MSNSSSVFYSQINTGFPLVGKDNDSSVFKQNFTNIQTSLELLDSSLTQLEGNAVKLSSNNDFDFNQITRAQFANCGDTIADYSNQLQSTTVVVDYAQGGYQKFSIDKGLTQFTVINWPVGLISGRIVVAVKRGSDEETLITFGSGAVNLSQAQWPVKLNSDVQLFEIVSDNGLYYVKHLNNYVNFSDISSENVTANQFSATNATITDSLTIGTNTYTTGSGNATVVTDGSSSGRIALVPDVVTTTVTSAETDSPTDITATKFGVVSAKGILVGARFTLPNLDRVFSVLSVDTTKNTVTTQPFSVGITEHTISFYNPTFEDQSSVLSLARDSYTTNSPITMFSRKNDKYGDGFVNPTLQSLTVTFDDYAGDPTAINKLRFFTDNVDRTFESKIEVMGTSKFNDHIEFARGKTIGSSDGTIVLGDLRQSVIDSKNVKVGVGRFTLGTEDLVTEYYGVASESENLFFASPQFVAIGSMGNLGVFDSASLRPAGDRALSLGVSNCKWSTIHSQEANIGNDSGSVLISGAGIKPANLNSNLGDTSYPWNQVHAQVFISGSLPDSVSSPEIFGAMGVDYANLSGFGNGAFFVGRLGDGPKLGMLPGDPNILCAGAFLPFGNNMYSLGGVERQWGSVHTKAFWTGGMGLVELDTTNSYQQGLNSMFVGLAGDASRAYALFTTSTEIKMHGSVVPHPGTPFSLGKSTLPWKDVWAINSVIQTSDASLKTNIKAVELGLDFVNKLRPVQYSWKNGDEHTNYGFIAQEVGAVLDDSGATNTAMWVDVDGTQHLRYTELLAPIVKAIQQLTARVDELSKR